MFIWGLLLYYVYLGFVDSYLPVVCGGEKKNSKATHIFLVEKRLRRLIRRNGT
ncbi:hypothetical protein Scep_003072 [Stephania cephalantha]|uniref:Uncharacterized protein n=1 Tax=Stephania cephalantha TaxID=152367 RepID=A0AAP0KRC7_9MAGN